MAGLPVDGGHPARVVDGEEQVVEAVVAVHDGGACAPLNIHRGSSSRGAASTSASTGSSSAAKRSANESAAMPMTGVMKSAVMAPSVPSVDDASASSHQVGPCSPARSTTVASAWSTGHPAIWSPWTASAMSSSTSTNPGAPSVIAETVLGRAGGDVVAELATVGDLLGVGHRRQRRLDVGAGVLHHHGAVVAVADGQTGADGRGHLPGADGLGGDRAHAGGGARSAEHGVEPFGVSWATSSTTSGSGPCPLGAVVDAVASVMCPPRRRAERRPAVRWPHRTAPGAHPARNVL